MSPSVEKSVDHAIKYGAAFAQVSSPHSHENDQDIDPFQLNSVARVVFGVATVTFEVCGSLLGYPSLK